MVGRSLHHLSEVSEMTATIAVVEGEVGVAVVEIGVDGVVAGHLIDIHDDRVRGVIAVGVDRMRGVIVLTSSGRKKMASHQASSSHQGHH